MSLRPAYIYDDRDIFVEFDETTFRKLLREYLDKHGDVDKALDAIKFDLKQKTRYK